MCGLSECFTSNKTGQALIITVCDEGCRVGRWVTSTVSGQSVRYVLVWTDVQTDNIGRGEQVGSSAGTTASYLQVPVYT